MRKIQILLENALESWSIAVRYCNDIQNGLATLHYQKTFVSALHNTIELLLKQIMLDDNDHSVISDVAVKSEEEAKLQLAFYQSKKLNEFFLSLSDEERNIFHSIEFSKLIDRKNKILKSYFDALDDATRDSRKGELAVALTLLNNLRNNETHFYISKIDYLSCKDFITLHNLMIVIYEIMEKYNLLPYFGEPWDEFKHLAFKFKEIDPSFSFYNAVCSSPIAKSVKETLTEKSLFSYGDRPYELAEEYFGYLSQQNKQSSYTFNEILSIITMMNQFDLIKFTPYDDVVIPPDCDDRELTDFEKDMLTTIVRVRSIFFDF